jgi:hypothetical protein
MGRDYSTPYGVVERYMLCATLVRGYQYLTPYGVSLQCTKLPRAWYNNFHAVYYAMLPPCILHVSSMYPPCILHVSCSSNNIISGNSTKPSLLRQAFGGGKLLTVNKEIEYCIVVWIFYYICNFKLIIIIII